MDLQYAQGRLVGTYNGNRVDIELDGPAHRARVSGIFAGLPMSVNWRLGGSSSQHHSTLHGRFADSTLTLTGEFHINGSIVQSASLSGRFAGVPIEAVIEAADGGLSDYRTVAIDGDFAGTRFALFATIGHMTGNIVAGTIDNIPVRVDAKVQAPEGPTNFTGSYHGPEALLALIVGTLLFFC